MNHRFCNIQKANLFLGLNFTVKQAVNLVPIFDLILFILFSHTTVEFFVNQLDDVVVMPQVAKVGILDEKRNLFGVIILDI
jgi:hypothetical protein